MSVIKKILNKIHKFANTVDIKKCGKFTNKYEIERIIIMNFFDESTLKKILYTFLAVLIVSTIAVFCVYIWYGNNIKNTTEEYSLETKEYDLKELTKEASSTNDKNISVTNTNANSISVNSVNKNENKNVVENNVKSSSGSVSNSTKSKENKEVFQEKKPEVKKELKFVAPVDGEIIKDFASETLIYSKTLDEWTTHLGIDIKGNKTAVVKAAEEGVVESIKNDPRFGLTVTISHQDGFKTIYSNLLTTEFVKEGDKVSKGDTIATIGESASFEVLDEPHLHFEIYIDEMPVNPTVYLK